MQITFELVIGLNALKRIKLKIENPTICFIQSGGVVWELPSVKQTSRFENFMSY